MFLVIQKRIYELVANTRLPMRAAGRSGECGLNTKIRITFAPKAKVKSKEDKIFEF
jgi:hypothetical protein